MGRIQSNIGLATGLNITDTVDQLMKISSASRDRLQSRVKAFQSQQVSINELTALVIGVQLQTDRIGNVSNLSTTTPTSSKPDVVSVSSLGSPVPGTYSVRTIQTAQSSAGTSNAYSSASDKVSAGTFTVRTGGFVDTSSRLDELRGGAGISLGSIRITDRSGSSKEIDLRSASSIDDVLRQINTTTGIKVNAKVSGDRIVLSDLTGQTTSNLIVEEVGDARTALDLGLGSVNLSANTATGDDIAFLATSSRLATLRDGRGIAFNQGNDLSVGLKDGSILTIDANSSSSPSTVGQLIAKINEANPSKLEARLSTDGNGIELVDKTSGTGTFAATGILAEQLGWKDVSGVSGTISGSRVQSALQGPLYLRSTAAKASVRSEM